jgi:hypothetical protein
MTGGGFGGCTVTLLKKVNKHWISQNKPFLLIHICFSIIYLEIFSAEILILKVCWQLSFFLFILSHSDHTFIITFIQYIHPSSFAEAALHFLQGVFAQWEKPAWGVPSRDLNSSLPYIRPAHYQLSFAASQLSYAVSF